MRALMIDDHVMFLQGLRNLLAVIAPTLQVECVTSPEAEVGELGLFDLVLLDWHLLGFEGDQAIACLRDRGCTAPIVVLSGETSATVVRRAIDLGAAGYIPKQFSSEQMVSALEQVMSGRVFLPVADGSPRSPPRSERPLGLDPRLVPLTPRQLDVYRASIRGLSNKQIARELGVAPSTVKAHLSAVFLALGVHNRTEAAFQAAREGVQLFPAVPASSITPAVSVD